MNDDAEELGRCHCSVCKDHIDAEIIRRGADEYIILNGRLLTGWHCSEDADYFLHENIVRQLLVEKGWTVADLEKHFAKQLWPEKAGVFTSDDTVDLYRAMMKVRNAVVDADTA